MHLKDRFVVKPGHPFKLSAIDPSFAGDREHNDSTDAELEKNAERLGELQYLMYAESQQSLLICLQGLDAAGKDGTIRHVLGAMNPQGTRVHGFKVPSPMEASHDFLWRAHCNAPARGEIVVFNRSHYEDVLVARVHNLVPNEVWSKRYDLINEFERNLIANGTTIVKFYLHISEDEQMRRFKQRLDDPKRHWKISEADYAERKFWPQYLTAYEQALSETSKAQAPWFVIPANHKWFRNLAVSKILLDTLEALKLKTPEPKVDLERIRREYHRAVDSSDRTVSKQ